LLHRRVYPRVAFDAPATLLVDNLLRKPSVVKDLSVRGAGIVTTYPVTLNQKVDLFIDAPLHFNKPIEREARVAWSKQTDDNLWRVGLDFNENHKLSLNELCHS
jgi:hypothetical protein